MTREKQVRGCLHIRLYGFDGLSGISAHGFGTAIHANSPHSFQLSKTKTKMKNKLLSLRLTYLSTNNEPVGVISDHTCATVIDKSEKRVKTLYVHGGRREYMQGRDDLNSFDVKEQKWSHVEYTQEYRIGHANCTVVNSKGDSILVIMGGYEAYTQVMMIPITLFNVTSGQFINTDEFSNVDANNMNSGKWGHSVAVSTNLVVVFGGRNVDGVCTSDVEVYMWLKLRNEVLYSKTLRCLRHDSAQNAILNMYGHSAIMRDSCHMVVFGGCTGDNVSLNQLLEYNVKTETWTMIGKQQQQQQQNDNNCWPSPRDGHRAVFLSNMGRRGQMMISGGNNGSQSFSDIWVYDFHEEIWQQIDSNLGLYHFGPRSYHTMNVDEEAKTLIVLGGWKMESNELLDELAFLQVLSQDETFVFTCMKQHLLFTSFSDIELICTQ